MSEMKIVKTASCESLSSRSTLTYNIGYKDESDIYLCLAGNTGSGIFNKDWIPLEQVESVLASANPITSGSLHGLFEGKSSNSAGFVLAVLLNEKLVQISPDNARHYERVEPTAFTTAIQTLKELVVPATVEKTSKKKTGKKVAHD